ncbi:MAG TPA: hypothetical protein VMM57_10870 [Bacteroidota bacterium]|nr:hypothetical protein [Bacteroidota bacterium]
MTKFTHLMKRLRPSLMHDEGIPENIKGMIMRKTFFGLSIVTAVGLLELGLVQTLGAQQPGLAADDNIPPETFTQVLKDEWIFLKDQTDQFLAQTTAKGEFETSAEFAARIEREKAAYESRLKAQAADKKLDQRVFGVLLKATFVSYDADKQIYAVRSGASIEAPYDIPSLICFVPSNPYVVLSDTVQKSYRLSKLSLKFHPDFKWSVARDVARAAKVDEGDVYFKVKFIVDISQEEIQRQAKLKIIPREIELFNLHTQTDYWRQELK